MEEEYDLSVKDFLKKVKNSEKTLFWIGLTALLALSFFIRTANMDNLGSEILASDPYVFLRYAKDLVERGRVPVNDTMRYYPFGFETGYEAPMPSYAIFMIYSVAKVFNPAATVLWAAQVYPAVFSTLAFLVFALLVLELTGDKRVALASLALLITLPALLYRTMAGFADKEPIVTFFSLLAILAYVKALKTGKKSDKKCVAWALASGIITGLAALSGGLYIFAVFSLCVYNLLSMLFLRVGGKRFKTLVTWFLSQLPLLVLPTKRFGGWEVYNHMSFQVPAVTVAVITIYLIIEKLEASKRMPASVLAITGLAVLGIVFGATLYPGGLEGLVSSIHTRLTYPLGYNPFQQSVSENQPPYVYDPQGGTDWVSNLSWVFPLMLGGAILVFYQAVKKIKKGGVLTTMFAIFLLFFIFSRFSSDQKFRTITNFFTNYNILALYAFLAALVLFVLYNGVKADYDKIDWKKLFLISWLLMSVIGARGVIRLMFVAAQPAAVMAAFLLIKTSDLAKKRTKDWLYTLTPLAVLVLVFASFTATAYASANSIYPSFNQYWDDATTWIRENTAEDAAFVHWWDYGYWVQTRGGRATVLDGGNFFGPQKIAREFFTSSNRTQVSETLNYYGNPEYLLIESSDVFKFYQISRIGRRNSWFSALAYRGDRQIQPPFNNMSKIRIYQPGGGIQLKQDYVNQKLWAKESTYIGQVVVPYNQSGEGAPQVVLINPNVGREVFPISCVCEYGACRTINESGVPGCLMEFENALIYVPEELRDMLFTKVYLLNNYPGVEEVYDNNVSLGLNSFYGGATNIRIYRINYSRIP